jgi:phage-related protein
LRTLHWVGSSLADLKKLPKDVRAEAGFALYLAQIGMKAGNALPMKGFGGASVLEVVIDERGNTYRAVYTVKFAEAVYVLHVFKKKSKRGIRTPLTDVSAIKGRLKEATLHYHDTYSANENACGTKQQ